MGIEEIIARLEKIRKEHFPGMGLFAFERHLGLKRQTYWNCVRKNHAPGVKNIMVLTEALSRLESGKLAAVEPPTSDKRNRDPIRAKEVINNLELLRERMGLSKKEFAKFLPASCVSYYKWCSGHCAPRTKDMLDKIQVVIDDLSSRLPKGKAKKTSQKTIDEKSPWVNKIIERTNGSYGQEVKVIDRIIVSGGKLDEIRCKTCGSILTIKGAMKGNFDHTECLVCGGSDLEFILTRMVRERIIAKTFHK